ncbi:MAG: hypothetical protein IT299_09435 [Dehalococcoidia bacterium]|nr:hypothetical protein [Dehalococcoidia bacterium]
MPPREIDWDAERGKAGQATQRSLIALAELAGYDVRRAKGGHFAADRRLARPIVIQSRMYRIPALRIIDALERGTRDG